MRPITAPSDSQRVSGQNGSMSVAKDEGIGGNIVAAYREHAPLALFSLGSLAVGGAFYAIAHGANGSRSAANPADRSQFTAAVSVAGLSALLAAGSYFYYVRRAKARAEADPLWDASVSGAPDGAGGVAMGARLTLALSSLR